MSGANQFQVKAAVNVPEEQNIRSGYSANAEIVLQSATQVLTIPESAIEFTNDSSFVYLVGKDGDYTKKAVQTGISDGLNIEIKSGLSTSDKIRGSKIIESKQ